MLSLLTDVKQTNCYFVFHLCLDNASSDLCNITAEICECNGGMFSISFVALVAKMPLIYPIAPFFNNERETGDCVSER